MSIPWTRPAGAAASSAADPDIRRPVLPGLADLLAVAGLLVGAGVIEFFLRHLLTRPFYNDEAWRAYDIARGTGYPVHTTPGPLALGWLGIENVARLVLGNTEAGLRAPMFLALPLLAVATYWLARRWLGVGVSFCVAGLLLLNSWIVNYALQLKSDSYEALLAIVAVALYLLVRRTTWHPAMLLGLYAALGLTCVFSLPNLFVVVPLLALDLVEALRARDRVALRIGGEALAGAIALAHYVLFVRPQARIADVFFHADYAPHAPAAFVRFAIKGAQVVLPVDDHRRGRRREKRGDSDLRAAAPRPPPARPGARAAAGRRGRGGGPRRRRARGGRGRRRGAAARAPRVRGAPVAVRPAARRTSSCCRCSTSSAGSAPSRWPACSAARGAPTAAGTSRPPGGV